MMVEVIFKHHLKIVLKEEYERLFSKLQSIDLSKVVELQDNTDLSGELACAGGACEIK
jgi:ribonucleoside-triphosphate reductase (thioredoxin)